MSTRIAEGAPWTATKASSSRVTRRLEHRQSDGDLQRHPVAFIQHRQETRPPAVVERVAHDVERPRALQDGRGRLGLPHARRDPSRRTAEEVEPQRAQRKRAPRSV